MTIEELNDRIDIGDVVIFSDDEQPPTSNRFAIINEEGIEYHIVYYYVGEFDEIDNTYIHHYGRNGGLETLKITLNDDDRELLSVMCDNYREVYM